MKLRFRESWKKLGKFETNKAQVRAREIISRVFPKIVCWKVERYHQADERRVTELIKVHTAQSTESRKDPWKM